MLSTRRYIVECCTRNKSIMACDTSIPVYYINETGTTDFTVNIYATKFSKESWRSINAQSSATFNFDLGVEVGASYTDNGLYVVAGPFRTEPGNVWQVKQNSPTSTAILSRGKRISSFKF